MATSSMNTAILVILCGLVSSGPLHVLAGISVQADDLGDLMEQTARIVRLRLQKMEAREGWFREGVLAKLETLATKLEWAMAEGGLSPAHNGSTIHGMLVSLEDALKQLQKPQRTTFRVSVTGEGGIRSETPPGSLFSVNGQPVPGSPRRRGFNVVALRRVDGSRVAQGKFDTYGSTTASARLVTFLQNVPTDSIVLVSAMDEASRRCSVDCYDALRDVGFTRANLTSRDTYALVGYKGSVCGTRPSWVKEGYALYPGTTRRRRLQSRPVTLVSVIDPDNCY